MDIVRTILIVAAVVVVAWIAFHVLAIVTGFITTVFTILVVAALVYGLFWLARSSMRRRITPQR